MEQGTPNLLIIEPFYGGSHQQLVDLLRVEIKQCVVYILPAKKWHWKARTSALYFSQVIPYRHDFKILFCSSVLNLAELIALRPDLSALNKVVYFHENQLVYPVRKHQDRDFQYGYNQILTCLVADTVLFNSKYNKESFLASIPSFLKLIPDHRPKGISDKIKSKCSVLYFPIIFPETLTERHVIEGSPEVFSNKTVCSDLSRSNRCELSLMQSVDDSEGIGSDETTSQLSGTLLNATSDERPSQCSITKEQKVECESSAASGADRTDGADQEKSPLIIVWPHRWEHDKNPELFFQTMYKLKAEKCCFKLVVMGETYTDVPRIFHEAALQLKDNILKWGYQENKSSYYDVLQQCDVVVSTAKHEFFGVAMLEAASLGCYPLVPNDLVYPEIFPNECLYNNGNQLFKRLKQFCWRPHLAQSKHLQIDFSKYSWQNLKKDYTSFLQPMVKNATLEERNLSCR